MIDVPASLRPVAGHPGEIATLLGPWLSDSGHEPLVVRTSGSTGEPKGVALSVSAVRASAAATLARLGGPGQWVLALPAHYVAGLMVIVRSILAGTSPVVLDDHHSLVSATEALHGSRRYLAIVPTQLHRWLADEASATALHEYDAVLLGGSAAGESLLAEARARGIRVVTTYGMSETCGGCVYEGVALDGVAVALSPEGQVRLAGPVLFDGYVGRPDLTTQVRHDGWFHTPDLGRFDGQGRLEVLGRVDDTVVSGGVNIPLPAVERRIRSMPGIDDVAVVGVPDDEWGVSVTAVVTAASTVDLDEVRDFVSERHPRAWAPRRVLQLGSLPILASGKVDRQRLLREMGVTR